MEHYMTAIGIVLITIVAGYIFRKLFQRYIHNSPRFTKLNPTNFKFIAYAVSALIYITGMVLAAYTVPEFKEFGSKLAAGAGIAVAAVGLASQQALGNIVSGVFVIVSKPYKINDWISIENGSIIGYVEDITLRHTVIRNYENQRVIVPNSTMGKINIINGDYLDSNICKWVDFTVSHKANLDRAKRIILDEIIHHPMFMDGRSKKEKEDNMPIVPIKVIEWGPYYLKLRSWVWVADTGTAFVLKCDLLESVKKRFDSEGIEIPYPKQKVMVHQAPLSHMDPGMEDSDFGFSEVFE